MWGQYDLGRILKYAHELYCHRYFGVGILSTIQVIYLERSLVAISARKSPLANQHFFEQVLGLHWSHMSFCVNDLYC